MRTSNYGKLNEYGSLERLTRIPGVFCPSEATITKYAADNGYKPINDTPQPNPYYTGSWENDGQSIVRVWTPIELEEAKRQALERVQEELNFAVKQRTEVNCEALDKAIIYDQDALFNAMGLEAGDYFICADDSVIQVTDEQIAAIKATLKEHREGIYGEATRKRGVIARAESVDELVELGML